MSMLVLAPVRVIIMPFVDITQAQVVVPISKTQSTRNPEPSAKALSS